MAKLVTFEEDASAALKSGVEKAARAIKATLGPRGRTALIDRGWGSPKVTRDGHTVADEIDLKDKRENLAAKMLKEAASKTSDQAGDGTTTCVVIAEAIFTEGLKYKTAGCDPMALARGINRAVEAALEKLKELAKPVEDRIEFVATVAANNDPTVGKMIADAMRKVGKDGAITVEEGKSIETEVNIVQGMQFDRGFISPHFVTNPDSAECVLEDAYILVHDEKLTSARDLVPLLERIAQEKKPLLIIAENVEGDALATLVVNRLKGILQCCAVKSPGYGERRRAMLIDIATMTGGRAIYKELGEKTEKISTSDLGRAKKVIVNADNCTIIGGYGDESAIKARVEQIRREIKATTSDYDREKLQERLAKLTGGVATIRVGGATETEVKEKKSRVENALNATRAAVETGILPGGGVALVRALPALDSLQPSGDEAFGVEVVKRALVAPLKQLARNAGYEGSIVLKKVQAAETDVGFDVLTGQYRNMIEAGIIDPLKVTRTALLNGASVATLLLTGDTLVTEKPKKKPKARAHPAGHGHHHAPHPPF